MKKIADWKYENFGLYEGVTVPLETPMIELDEEP